MQDFPSTKSFNFPIVSFGLINCTNVVFMHPCSLGRSCVAAIATGHNSRLKWEIFCALPLPVRNHIICVYLGDSRPRN
uniref:Uncharacterized protein n=1 Tax=Rhizophora mucronata TaxID=61149 RepID=A0A2P2NCJ0_RHIMU